MTDDIKLSLYCDTLDFSRPFLQDGRTIATNKAILIAVDGETTGLERRATPNVSSILDFAFVDGVPIPAIDQPQKTNDKWLFDWAEFRVAFPGFEPPWPMEVYHRSKYDKVEFLGRQFTRYYLWLLGRLPECTAIIEGHTLQCQFDGGKAVLLAHEIEQPS